VVAAGLSHPAAYPDEDASTAHRTGSILASFALGIGFYHAAWQAEQRLSIILPDEWQGRNIEVIGVVAELPHSHEHGQRFSFTVEQILTPQASMPKHIYLST
jgi:competence protein ComEC